MTKVTLTSSFFRDMPMIWTKTDEAVASFASIVATAMFTSAVDSFREKNAIGCQSLPLRYSSCAPNAMLEASTVRLV